MEITLEVQGVTVSYGAWPALKEVSFTVSPGDFIALIGPNGSGKSTFLRTLSRVLKPKGGVVLLNQKDLFSYSLREVAQKIAVVSQEENSVFDFSVKEVVALGRLPHLGRWQKETKEDRGKIAEALELTATNQLASRPFRRLSGGEKQRVIIARALAQEPQILLLDEPTAHLDLNFQGEILGLVRRLNQARKITVIAAIHDLNLALEFFSRFILLKEGKVLASGEASEVITPENIREAYSPRVKVYPHPLTHRPQVMVTPELPPPNPEKGRVHLVCGGGSGLKMLESLPRAGYQVTAGVLNEGDSDCLYARLCGLEVVTVPPFSPISPGALAQVLPLLSAAGAVVVASAPFGRGNLRNLEAVSRVAREGMPVFLFNEIPLEERDYTGGRAKAYYQQLLLVGAREVRELEELERLLENTPLFQRKKELKC